MPLAHKLLLDLIDQIEQESNERGNEHHKKYIASRNEPGQSADIKTTIESMKADAWEDLAHAIEKFKKDVEEIEQYKKQFDLLKKPI